MLQVVKRTGKLAYVWRGTANLPALVEQLKREEEEGMPVVDRKGNSPIHQQSEQQDNSLALDAFTQVHTPAADSQGQVKSLAAKCSED